MRPDPGRAIQESAIASLSSRDRTAVVARLRENGRWAVWRQVDSAGIDDPVEVAEFVLRRLYPELREESLAEVLGQLRAAHAAGTWVGFERPGIGRRGRRRPSVRLSATTYDESPHGDLNDPPR